ncbi:MAG TPA: glutamine amidotransferase [Actinomycetales bacterium]|nr:glutamine amidotransferase [Actinomycetales bacterium]
MTRPVHVIQLYARDMNVYGDWGNVLTLARRLEWRGHPVEVTQYNPGDPFPGDADILVGGGGQDAGQVRIQADLLGLRARLADLVEAGTPMLMICGMYQLFGRFFRTAEGRVIEGVGLLGIETHAGPNRLIGNVAVHHDDLGEIVGYENHSGQTYLGDDARPFAMVVRGAGNNGEDGTEGAVRENVIGTYMHGPLLPKNPAVADLLIERAVHRELEPLTSAVDQVAALSRQVAVRRPR